MEQGMTLERWLSLGMRPNALAVYGTGGLLTVEAADTAVVGIPRHREGHHVLGTASSREEAVAVATVLRLFNPN